MRYYQGLSDGALTSTPSVFVLGFFDGLHLGHQYLLQRGRRLADSFGLSLVAMAFSSNEWPCLVTSCHKRRLFERSSVDILIDVPLTPDVKRISALSFVKRLQRMVPIHTWAGGTDLRFGKDREGSCAFLADRGDIKTLFIERLQQDGESISSTKIRQFVAAGELARASSFLGRPYSLVAPATPCGPNRYALEVSHVCLPPAGEYAAMLENRLAALHIGKTCYIALDEPLPAAALANNLEVVVL